MSAKKAMGRPERPIGPFFYRHLMEVSGLSRNAIYQHTTRDTLDLEDFESVLVWCIRHARPDLRERLITYALNRQVD